MADGIRIAIALDYPLTLRGGVSVIVESLIEHLPASYDIVLISPDDPEELRKHACASRLNGHICFNSAGLTSASARNLTQNIGRHNVSLVHFHAGENLAWGNRRGWKSPIPFLRRSGIPSIFSTHMVNPIPWGYYDKSRPRFLKWMLLALVWGSSVYALSHAKKILTDAQHDARLLKRNYPPLTRRIQHVYHSRLVDSPDLRPNLNRAKTILAVGHIAHRKGQHVLAGAFAQLAHENSDWALNIAGPVLQQPCADLITDLIKQKQLNGRINLLGSHPSPAELMKNCGIFVQPSFGDALPLALQEAMFHGCACVAARTGGIPELIAHGKDGLLFEPGNIGELAQHLQSLISNPVFRAQLAQNAWHSVREKGMTAQRMAASYDTIYREIL